MKKKITSIITFVLTLAICVGVFDNSFVYAKKKSNDPSKVTGKVMKVTKKSKATTDEMLEGYNSFSIRALKEAVADEKEGQNLMISPASLMFALDMAAMGAKGDTYKQMAALIRKGATKRDLVTFAKNYRSTLEKSGLVNIANSLWINENNLIMNNVKINEAYLNMLRKHFKAASASRAFNDSVKDEINSWISEKTKGMIPKTLNDLSQSTLMLIINAMSFEGKWKREYKDSQVNENGKFTNFAGEKETAKMLSSEEDYYFETESAKGFIKYYEGNKYAFMAILPLDAKISVNDFVKGLSDDAFAEMYDSIYPCEVDTMTPAFSFDYSIVMNDMLKRMGMKNAFYPGADFYTMLSADSNPSSIDIYIGSVIQKTHIELDEKGTKAAAVTIIDVKGEGCAPGFEEERKEVILNRPFAFAIVDTENGTPVFEGIVNTLKK